MDRVIEQKKINGRKIFILVFFIIGVLALSYRVFSISNSSKLSVSPDSVRFSTVTIGDFQEYIPISGDVKAETTVYLDLESGGIVESILIESGNAVKKGDLILRLSNANIQKSHIDSESFLLENLTGLRNSKNELLEKKLSLKNDVLDLDYKIVELTNKYRRFKLLHSSDSTQISVSLFEDTENELDYLRKKRKLLSEKITQENEIFLQQNKQIESSIVRVNKSLDMLSMISDSLNIKASIDGYLSSMDAQVGESFKQGERMGQIDVLDKFKVIANVDQYYISRIKIGQKGKFGFDDKVYILEVSKIYPEVTNNSFKIDLIFKGKIADGIKRGQTLNIDLAFENSKDSVLVSKSGFYKHTKGRWVYKVNNDESGANKVFLEVGKQNPKNIEILGGLNVGDIIISSNYEKFNDVDVINFES